MFDSVRETEKSPLLQCWRCYVIIIIIIIILTEHVDCDPSNGKDNRNSSIFTNIKYYEKSWCNFVNFTYFNNKSNRDIVVPDNPYFQSNVLLRSTVCKIYPWTAVKLKLLQLQRRQCLAAAELA